MRYSPLWVVRMGLGVMTIYHGNVRRLADLLAGCIDITAGRKCCQCKLVFA